MDVRKLCGTFLRVYYSSLRLIAAIEDVLEADQAVGLIRKLTASGLRPDASHGERCHKCCSCKGTNTAQVADALHAAFKAPAVSVSVRARRRFPLRAPESRIRESQ